MTENFVRLVERDESPLFVSLISLGFTRRYFKTALDWDLSVEHHRYEVNTHFISGDDAAAIREKVNSGLSGGVDFISCFIAACRGAGAQLLSTAEYLASAHLREDSHSLQAQFCEFTESVKNAMPFLVAVVIVERLIEPLLFDLLAREAPEKDTQVLLGRLLVPKGAPAVVQEIRDTYQIALSITADTRCLNAIKTLSPSDMLHQVITENPSLLGRINEHVRAFGWLRTHGYRHAPMTQYEVIQRLQTIVRRWDSAHIAGVAQEEAPFDLNKTLGFSPSHQLAELVDGLRELVSLRFYRIDVHLQAYCMISGLMHRIANACGSTDEEIVFASEPEIIASLHESRPLNRIELAARRDNSFWLRRDLDKMLLGAYSKGPDGRPTAGVLSGKIVGTSASPGLARGRSKIVRGAEEMSKLEMGDVLVTTMTTPDLMLAIEKAAAIITDEGGILSHAAIISRELGIPAVIATGNATQCLSDGLYLDVDAREETGVITIIE